MEIDHLLDQGILDTMVEAQWISNCVYENGKGFSVTWTPEGKRKAGLLRLLARRYGLMQSAHAPRIFDQVAHGERQEPQLDLPPHVKEIWVESVAELQIDREDPFNGVMALVHVSMNHAPDLMAEENQSPED